MNILNKPYCAIGTKICQSETSETGSFHVNDNAGSDQEIDSNLNQIIDSYEFISSLDIQINKRVAASMKQAMQLVLKKLDGLIDMKISNHNKAIETR